MQKLTYAELVALFRLREKQRPDREPLVGHIVFTEDSFTKHYPKKSRTYIVSSNNKAYQEGMVSNSIFGTCIDGTDTGVRLDLHMSITTGNPKGWNVEYCYLPVSEP